MAARRKGLTSNVLVSVGANHFYSPFKVNPIGGLNPVILGFATFFFGEKSWFTMVKDGESFVVFHMNIA